MIREIAPQLQSKPLGRSRLSCAFASRMAKRPRATSGTFLSRDESLYNAYACSVLGLLFSLSVSPGDSSLDRVLKLS
jgi:hypothetical protein